MADFFSKVTTLLDTGVTAVKQRASSAAVLRSNLEETDVQPSDSDIVTASNDASATALPDGTKQTQENAALGTALTQANEPPTIAEESDTGTTALSADRPNAVSLPVTPDRAAGKRVGSDDTDTNASPDGRHSLSLETATRDQLIAFLRKQALHIKKVESRCTEIVTAYRKVSKERKELLLVKQEVDKLQSRCTAAELARSQAETESRQLTEQVQALQTTLLARNADATLSANQQSAASQAVALESGELALKLAQSKEVCAELVEELSKERVRTQEFKMRALAAEQQHSRELGTIRQELQKHRLQSDAQLTELRTLQEANAQLQMQVSSKHQHDARAQRSSDSESQGAKHDTEKRLSGVSEHALALHTQIDRLRSSLQGSREAQTLLRTDTVTELACVRSELDGAVRQVCELAASLQSRAANRAEDDDAADDSELEEERLRTEFERAERQLLVVRADLEAARQQCTQHQAAAEEATAQHQQLTSQHAELSSQHKDLMSQHAELSSQHERLTLQHAEFSSQHEELTSQHAALTAENKQLAGQHEELAFQREQLTSKLTAQNTELAAQLSVAQGRVLELESRRTEAVRRNDDEPACELCSRLSEERTTPEERLQKHKHENTVLEERLRKHEQAHTAHEQERTSLEERLQQMEEERLRARESADEANAQLRVVNEEKTAVDVTHAQHTAEVARDAQAALDEQVRRSTERQRALEQRVEELSAQKNALEERLQPSTRERDELVASSQQLEQENARLEERLQRLSEELPKEQERVRLLELERSTQQSALEESAARLHSLQEEQRAGLADAEMQRDQALEKVSSLEESLRQLQADRQSATEANLLELRSALQRSAEELATAREQQQQRSAKFVSVSAQHEESSAQLEVLRAEAEQLRTQLSETRAESATLGEKLRTAQAALAAGEERHRTILEHVKTLEAEAAQASESQRSAEEALAHKQEELESALDRLRSTTEHSQELETQLEEQREVASKQSDADQTEAERVESLEEKLRKLRHLLGMANKRIGESKTLLSSRQNAIKVLTEKQIELKKALKAAHSEKGKLDATAAARLEEDYREKLTAAHAAFASKTTELETKISNLHTELEAERAEQKNYRHKAHSALQQAEKRLGTVSDLEAEVVRLSSHLEEAQLKEQHLNSFVLELQSQQTMTSALSDELQETQRKHAELSEELRLALLRADRAEESLLAAQVNLTAQLNSARQEHVQQVEQLSREHQQQSMALRQELERLREHSDAQQTEQRRHAAELQESLANTEQALRQARLSQHGAHTSSAASVSSSIAVAVAPSSADEDHSSYTAASSSRPPSRSASSSALSSLGPTATQLSEAGSAAVALDDPPMLHYAQIHASQASALSVARRQIQELTEQLHETEEHMRLIQLQENTLKENIRDLERSKTRENENLDYLKNVIVKYMETNEHESLLPVIATILHLSPDEVRRVKTARSSRGGASSLFGVSLWGGSGE